MRDAPHRRSNSTKLMTGSGSILDERGRRGRLAAKLEPRTPGTVACETGWMVIDMDNLRGLGPDLEEADSKTVFAFGVVVGAFVPLLLLALG
jgi:hypothetical protein